MKRALFYLFVLGCFVSVGCSDAGPGTVDSAATQPTDDTSVVQPSDTSSTGPAISDAGDPADATTTKAPLKVFKSSLVRV
jgi:hypothetical protein